MCPACVLSIGGGLFLASKLGINNIFIAGLLTVLLSIFIDTVIRKMNKGKPLFDYQRIIIPIILLTIVSIIFKFIY